MKIFPIILALTTLIVSHATAQVAMELALDQEEYLPGEAVPVAVKITNRSGQQLHLGADADWLTFSVESEDGFIVTKNAEVPVTGAFDLESSQMGTKHVDIAPYFTMTKPGRYKVTATMHIKAWSAELTSPVKTFDVVEGAKLWEQEFGVPTTGGLPEMRKFTLEQASYLHAQMRMYVELSDAPESRIYKTTALGNTVSFSRPEAQVDRTSQLHVLWQSGAQSFNYCVVGSDGGLLRRDIYDDFNTRPKLTVNDQGEVMVVGGVRRPQPGELPAVTPPVEQPPVTPTAAK